MSYCKVLSSRVNQKARERLKLSGGGVAKGEAMNGKEIIFHSQKNPEQEKKSKELIALCAANQEYVMLSSEDALFLGYGDL